MREGACELVYDHQTRTDTFNSLSNLYLSDVNYPLSADRNTVP